MREMNGFSFVFVHLHSHFTLSFLPIMAWQEASIIITLRLYSSIFSYIILINTHIPIDTLVKIGWLDNYSTTTINSKSNAAIQKFGTFVKHVPDYSAPVDKHSN